MVFSKKLTKIDYPGLFIGNEQIQKVAKHKQLGIIFNEKMSFDMHIEENCKKAMNRLSALQRLGNKIPRKGRLSIYISFIRPMLEFGFQLYDSSAKYLLERLERVQRQSLLYCSMAYKKTSHSELLKKVGLPSLETRRKIQKVQLIYKSKANLIWKVLFPKSQTTVKVIKVETLTSYHYQLLVKITF